MKKIEVGAEKIVDCIKGGGNGRKFNCQINGRLRVLWHATIAASTPAVEICCKTILFSYFVTDHTRWRDEFENHR